MVSLKKKRIHTKKTIVGFKKRREEKRVRLAEKRMRRKKILKKYKVTEDTHCECLIDEIVDGNLTADFEQCSYCEKKCCDKHIYFCSNDECYSHWNGQSSGATRACMDHSFVCDKCDEVYCNSCKGFEQYDSDDETKTGNQKKPQEFSGKDVCISCEIEWEEHNS